MQSSYNICIKECEKCRERIKKIDSFRDKMYSQCAHDFSRCSFYRAPEYLCNPCKLDEETLHLLKQNTCQN